MPGFLLVAVRIATWNIVVGRRENEKRIASTKERKSVKLEFEEQFPIYTLASCRYRDRERVAGWADGAVRGHCERKHLIDWFIGEASALSRSVLVGDLPDYWIGSAEEHCLVSNGTSHGHLFGGVASWRAHVQIGPSLFHIFRRNRTG